MTMEQQKLAYERQLSRLKEIIPTLASPSLVHLCSAWIERFTTCRPEEEMHRTKLVNLFVKQLGRDGKLGKPFLGTNIKMPFREILVDHIQEFESVKQTKRSDISLATIMETGTSTDSQHEDKYQQLCEKITQCLTRFESNFSQIAKHEHPLEQMRKLRFTEFADICRCHTGMELRTTIEQIQSHWLDIFRNIENANTRKSRPSTTKASSKTRSSSTESETDTLNTLSTGSLLSRTKSYDTQNGGSSTLLTDESNIPPKYKRFALKCAKRMEKMQQEIAMLKRASEIRESTEAIRYAALKSELVERAGAKQQAEMCAMIDQLDERYREMITKTMSLSFETQRGAKLGAS